MEIIKKKFKVRIKHYHNDHYTIEYAYYRFFRVWNPLLFWFSQSITANTECWSTALWKITDAEKFAQTLNSYEDILKYYEPQQNAEANFLRKKKEYYQKNVPYTVKNIK